MIAFNDLTVLYVETSTILLRQMVNFLSKNFKKVYQATDGLDGLEKYKEYKPDMILTNITMPKMDGYEMIDALKKIDINIKIIIISAHSDSSSLLKAIHLGISDFIPKPVDNALLQNTLLRVANELSSKNTPKKLNNEYDFMKKLHILHKNNMHIQFINHYRGVPIINEGNILEVGKSSITVYAPFIQALAINYEKITMFESDLIDTAIEARLDRIDSNNKEIKLKNLKTLEFSPKRRKELRVEPDNDFFAVLHIQDKRYMIKIKDISLNSVLLSTKLTDFYAKESDTANLSLGFKLYNNDKPDSFKRSERILCKGTIFKIKKNALDLDIVILFDLGKANEIALGRYIYQRQIELIKEFKQIKDSKLI